MFVFRIFQLVALIMYCYCQKELLEKFTQTDYKVKDFRMVGVSYDESCYNIFKIFTFKYNRSVAAVNMTFNYKIDVGDDVGAIIVQVYKFASNEYRSFPIRFQTTLSNVYEANIIGLQDAMRCGNFTTLYFVKNVTYYLCNFVMDESKLPPLMPNGRFKVEVTLLHSEKSNAVMETYFEVYRQIVPPKAIRKH